MTLEEVVNIIFEDCLQRCSFRLFDAILLMHPTSKLSSYDIIRRTIVEDKGEHFLTNQSLQEMITKYGLEADEAKLAACYDLAYLWYDSALVTQKAQQKTFEMMKSISQSRGVNLQLRDIRQLPNIKGEIENSLHPGTPVYYRVDLLKALIADHMMSAPKEATKYCVVCDIDVESMPSEQIFDQRTLDYLSSNGYVFNRHAVEADFENNFFIFNKEKEGLKEIHKETMINATAKNISVLRQYPQNGPIHGVGRKDILDAQYIYRRYPEFQSQMNEIQGCIMTPRKVVKCPNSQFNFGGNFLPSDFQSETFRFIGNDQVPYTIGGRNYHSENLEGQIDALKNWKVEPLTLPK